MIQEQKFFRKLTPDTPGNWLYCDTEDGRIYSEQVYLGKQADPTEWHECTDAERQQWLSRLPPQLSPIL